MEPRPVNVFERHRDVGYFPAEPLADNRHCLAKKVIDPRPYLAEQRAEALQVSQQFHPLTYGVAGQKPLVQQADLGANDEHNLGCTWSPHWPPIDLAVLEARSDGELPPRHVQLLVECSNVGQDVNIGYTPLVHEYKGHKHKSAACRFCRASLAYSLE
jgi:hypothetical protein